MSDDVAREIAAGGQSGHLRVPLDHVPHGGITCPTCSTAWGLVSERRTGGRLWACPCGRQFWVADSDSSQTSANVDALPHPSLSDDPAQQRLEEPSS